MIGLNYKVPIKSGKLLFSYYAKTPAKIFNLCQSCIYANEVWCYL